MAWPSPEVRRKYFKLYRDTHKGTPAWKAMCRESSRNQRHRKKKAIVDALGGKCERCGFNEHLYGLEFDHIKPKEKKDRRKECPSYFISGKSAKDAMEYITKNCRLLCANCHALKTVAYADNLKGKNVSDTTVERELYESKLTSDGLGTVEHSDPAGPLLERG